MLYGIYLYDIYMVFICIMSCFAKNLIKHLERVIGHAIK